jgi:hypothetical protein
MGAPDPNDWAVLVEHVTYDLLGQPDAAGMDMLFLESVLNDADIDCGFEPFRPGEEGGLYVSKAYGTTLRLVVPEPDLERAKALVSEALEGRGVGERAEAPQPDGLVDPPA